MTGAGQAANILFAYHAVASIIILNQTFELLIIGLHREIKRG
jgi:hypothetical protein